MCNLQTHIYPKNVHVCVYIYWPLAVHVCTILLFVCTFLWLSIYLCFSVYATLHTCTYTSYNIRNFRLKRVNSFQNIHIGLDMYWIVSLHIVFRLLKFVKIIIQFHFIWIGQIICTKWFSMCLGHFIHF